MLCVDYKRIIGMRLTWWRNFTAAVMMLGVPALLMGGCSSQRIATDEIGAALGSVAAGVFGRNDVALTDMAGTWIVDGAAVVFKSDSFLKRAGGVATAAAVEQQLNPYFKQYGLTGSKMQILSDGKFTLQLSRLSLTGTLTPGKDGTMQMSCYALGAIPVGDMTVYVRKSVRGLDLLFEADRVKDIMALVAKYSGMQMAGTVAEILGSYDGMYVGLAMSPALSNLQVGSVDVQHGGTSTSSGTATKTGTAQSGTSKPTVGTSTTKSSGAASAISDAGKTGREVLVEMVKARARQ